MVTRSMHTRDLNHICAKAGRRTQRAILGSVRVHHFQASIMQLFGLDHRQVTYRHAGVHGAVTQEVLS